MEANKTNTPATTETQPKAETKQPQPKAEQKPKSEAAPASPAQSKTEEQPTAPEEKQELTSLVTELRSLKNELGSTPIRVEHYRSSENTGREAGHQFLVGLAAGAGVALGVTAVTTVAWLIQRKIAGSDNTAE